MNALVAQPERLLDIARYTFERITVNANISVVFSQDVYAAKPSAVIIADPSVSSELQVSFDSANREIKFTGCKGATASDVKLVISAPYVKAFQLNGDGLFAIRVSRIGSMSVALNGNGRIVIEGHCESVKKTINGNGEIDARALSVTGKSGVFVKGNGQIIHNAAPILSSAAVAGNGRVVVVSGTVSNAKTSGNGSIQSMSDYIKTNSLSMTSQSPVALGHSPASKQVDARLSDIISSLNEPDNEVADEHPVPGRRALRAMLFASLLLLSGLLAGAFQMGLLSS